MMRGHESAFGHVSGTARYTDEIDAPGAAIVVHPVQARIAHARILRIETDAAANMPGVLAILTGADIPGSNDTGPIIHDEPLLPLDRIQYHGQVFALVLAENDASARAAASLVKLHCDPLPAITRLRDAIAAGHFHLPPSRVARGETETQLPRAEHRVAGEVEIGGQDHFYLETQSSQAWIDAEGLLQITSSTQHPGETQHMVAHVLGWPLHRVVCRCLRMGGGFGGKETQANPMACWAALAAWKTGRPARIKLRRSADMQITGKRHPFLARYEVGFDAEGRIEAVQVELFADGGWSVDLSPPVLMRAMVHVDNAYYLPHVVVQGRIAKTNLPSNTAFRGFGGPQGMLVAEEILDHVARYLGRPTHEVRALNFYRGDDQDPRNQTHYGQPVVDNHLPDLWNQLLVQSISFNKTEYNQAGALLHVYLDGSIQIHHGGTEMGQGLHSKMLVVAARTLGVNVARCRVLCTATDKVPNTSATAASSGSDLNGQALKAACETLLLRMRPVAARLLSCASEAVRFAGDAAFAEGDATQGIPFTDLVRACYNERISLSATGYYRTPGLSWDAVRGFGHPFYYFAFGAAVSEVEIDGDTGVHRLLRVDLLHDVGDSLLEAIDLGQIEGGFVQGMGWLTCEELVFAADGRLLTDAPGTYKIPTLGDVPGDFRTALFSRKKAPGPQTIFHSKGVGEPPLMLALSVREALREAIAAFAPQAKPHVALASPATPEAIWHAIERQRSVGSRE
jgi:xanthine dehydrogenase large subunit